MTTQTSTAQSVKTLGAQFFAGPQKQTGAPDGSHVLAHFLGAVDKSLHNCGKLPQGASQARAASEHAQWFGIDQKPAGSTSGGFAQAMADYVAFMAEMMSESTAEPAPQQKTQSGSNPQNSSQTPAAPERAQWYVIVREQFNFANASFTSATNAYAGAMAKVMNQFMNDSTQQQQTQTKQSTAYTQLASQIATQVAHQWELYNEELSEQSSSGLGFLGYLVAAITIVIGVLTEDPALVMMGVYSIVTQATHEDPIESFCEDLTGNKIAGEFLAGLVEACAGGVVDGVADKLVEKVCDKAAAEVAADAAARGAGAAEKTVAQKVASIVRTIIANLGMTLMMSTFWEDVAAQIPGVGKEGAMWLGLLFAVGFASGSGLLRENSLMKEIVEKAITNKFPDAGMTVLRGLILAMNLARNGCQMAEGVLMMKQADALNKAADILRKLGVTQSEFTLIQGLCDMFSQAMNQTQAMVKSVTDDYTAFNQTLPSLARMMDVNFQQAV